MIGVVAVCLEVFTTRIELEHVSEMAEAQKPMRADRPNLRGRSSYWGRYSFKELYYTKAKKKRLERRRGARCRV